MIFIDHKNFTANFEYIKEEKNQDRCIDYNRIGNFAIEYLSNNQQYKTCSLTHIRTYLYTGIYTDNLIKRIKDTIDKEKDADQKKKLESTLEHTEKKKESQKNFLNHAKTHYFFEIRDKPLQFNGNSVIQKGVDVQLAVDLVANAYQNNYDIAVLFSGDMDLLESIKTVKNLGKHVIIFSHYHNIAKEMIKEPDMFINLQHLDDKELNKFSHIFQHK